MGAVKEMFTHMRDAEVNEVWRKPALTLSQFSATKKGTKRQIKNVLCQFRMTTTQRDELKKLI